MTNSISTVVVIPCFNEERAIGILVQEVLQYVSSVVVVDDGSVDETKNVAESSGAQVIRLKENSGKGAALHRGLAQADKVGFEYAVTLDGDGQHAPADLPAFLNAAAESEMDLLVGNRMSNTAAMPWIRRTVNRWMSKRISGLAGQEFPDSQCGYRLIRLSAWREMVLSADRFEIESEMLLKFVKARKRVAFIPVQTVYKTEHSKIHPVHDTIRWIRWWRRAKR